MWHYGPIRRLGYTQVSPRRPDLQSQVDALGQVGVKKVDIFSDFEADRPVRGPALERLLAQVHPGDVVVVWSLDYLGFSLTNVVHTVKEIRDKDGRVHSILDGIDPDTGPGRFVFDTLATLAAYERELRLDRLDASVRGLRKPRARIGRPPVDPLVIEDKLTQVAEARARGHTAAEAADMVGWSRPTLYRYQQAARARKDEESADRND